MTNKLQEKVSAARKAGLLLKKAEGRFKDYYDLANFKEPVLMLMRRNKKVEFYEEATSGLFTFKHSDGEERAINLQASNLLTFPYGKKSFRGYICYEDNALPYPHDPIVTVQEFEILINKTLYDLKLWKSKEHLAMGAMWKQILIGVAIVIAALAAWKFLPLLLGGGTPSPDVVLQQASNITRIP